MQQLENQNPHPNLSSIHMLYRWYRVGGRLGLFASFGWGVSFAAIAQTNTGRKPKVYIDTDNF